MPASLAHVRLLVLTNLAPLLGDSRDALATYQAALQAAAGREAAGLLRQLSAVARSMGHVALSRHALEALAGEQVNNLLAFARIIKIIIRIAVVSVASTDAAP